MADHDARSWRFVHTGLHQQWVIETPRDGSGAPRWATRVRTSRGALGQALDCGFVGDPARYGDWQTEGDFADFCARMAHLPSAPPKVPAQVSCPGPFEQQGAR
ncbi:hypothetical protein [Nocardioides sp. Leaf285]|uniref:hypothetical protein n=1 Tax=Nocardioides sp. Leaf285 TaxID=1736322 RepID=UPI0007025982|nr:hypothetical protein [Nocardioides sp. Leaf285]KQP62988.1 hypothetical protein ASF47_18425 [Nocardioides sp. Leaf285]